MQAAKEHILSSTSCKDILTAMIDGDNSSKRFIEGTNVNGGNNSVKQDQSFRYPGAPLLAAVPIICGERTGKAM